nr:XRE family transcriptional regulator [Martelella mediterranea]
MARPEVEPKTPLARRLRDVRKALGDPERDELARAIGVSKNTLAAYERGETEPTATALNTYRKHCGVNVRWLVTGDGEMFEKKNELPKEASESTIGKTEWLPLPFFEAEAAAGFGRIALDELPTGSVAFERVFLHDLGASPDKCFLMKARGDSMQPTIPDNSLLIVDQSQTEINHGCIYVFRVGETLLVKRARVRMDNVLELISDNTAAYPPETIDATRSHELSVLGRVVYFCRVP